MVADNVSHNGFFFTSFNVRDMIKALVALRMRGNLGGRQHGIELHSHEYGVFHAVLSLSGMYAAAVHRYGRTRRVEILIFKLS